MRTIQRFTFLLGLAFAALADGISGRKLAINSAEAVAAPAELEVGLPSGISRTAVAARKAALIAAGTPEMHAERFAIDAERHQAWHDHPKNRTQAQVPGNPLEREAAAIRDAQRLDPNKAVKTLTSKQMKERAAAVKKVEDATEALVGVKETDRAAAEQLLAEARTALELLETQTA